MFEACDEQRQREQQALALEQLLLHTHGGGLLKDLRSERHLGEQEQELKVMTNITDSRCGIAFHQHFP